MRCDECRWWLSIFKSRSYLDGRLTDEGKCDYGECRRFPPKGATNGIDDSRFPITHKTRWCGEFAEKKVESAGG